VGGGDIQRLSKYESVSLHGILSTDRHLLAIYSVTNPKVKFMHSSNHTEQNSKYLYCLTRTKDDCTSVKRIFNWKARLVVTDKGRPAFLQNEPLPRLTDISAVTDCTLFFDCGVLIFVTHGVALSQRCES
jgi:hypothetical protein